MSRAAQHILREAMNVYSTEELRENIAASVTGHVIPYGITTYADPLTASNNQPTQHAYQQLMQRGEGVPARVNLMIRLPVRSQSIEANLDLVRCLLYSPPFQSDFLRVGTFKISLDKGRPGDKPYIVPAETGKAVLIEAHKRNWITTPETFDYACEALEEAYRLYPREDARHIFTHVGMPTRANLEVMKRLGILADLQVGRYYFMADDAEERYQVNPDRPDLGPGPVGTYCNAGIPLTLSSD
jgi:predicted amidohydrolase YtcJ